MATFRKRLGRWQSIVRVKGYPARTQSFDSKSDAKLWSSNIELELHREEHGLRKNKYPTFRECFERYRDEIVIHKKSKEMENKLIKYILTEGFVNYRVDKVDSSMIAGYRDRALKSLKSSSVNRRLAVISHMFSIAQKEWSYKVGNPVLAIRRPKNPEPRDRRFSQEELDKLLKGNRADPRTPNQRKKEAWAEKIAKKPRPKPTYINGNVIDLHPFIHDPWWLIHEEKPEDEDTSIQTPKGIIRAFVQKPRTDKGVASLFRLKKFS